MSESVLPVLKANYTVRPCTLDDLDAVLALINTCEMATVGQTEATRGSLLTGWQRPDFDPTKNQRVITTVDTHRVIGWAQIDSSQKVVLLTAIVVHPDYQHERIGEYLYGWVENAAHERTSLAPTDARIVLRAYTHAEDVEVWYNDLLLRSGMQIIRHSWRMEINLDAPAPSPKWSNGITLQVYDGVSDKRPICAVRRSAFQDQFGYVDRPFEEEYARWLNYWESDGKLVPGLWFLAMDGETIAGVCLCQPKHNGEEERGWISTLGVLREYRRRGIAEALLYTAFDAFYKMGKKRVGLGVDASSLTGAATLYKRVGMHVAKQFNLYEKELRSGVDLTTHG